MGSDLFALNALAKELNDVLRGARIDKIQQPEIDELRFFVRAGGKNLCLCMSCNALSPRMHLTTSKKQSPQVAPGMLMLLRKYLSSAAIESVGIFNNDRIVYVKFNARTEMRDNATFYIFVELMNRYSNIVFTDSDLKILDAVKHLPFDIAREHIVMRGVTYSPVNRPKPCYLNGCDGIFEGYNGGDLVDFIMKNLSGFSRTTVNEILFRAGIDDSGAPLSQAKREALKSVVEGMRNISPEPCAIGGEVYPIVYKSLPDSDKAVRFDTMNEAFDYLYTAYDADVRNKARLKTLATQAKRLYARVEKNILDDMRKLSECNDMEKYRVYGELIVNNIYLVKKGDKSLKCVNYYDGSEVEIPLDVSLPPSRNSANYYAKYNKLKRTKEFVSKKLVQDQNLFEYIKSINEEIEHLPYDASILPIEEELNSIGGGKTARSKGKVRKEAPDPPYIYLVDGFYIYRGKNNLQNDEITFKIASSNDIWMHLKAEHGAHTVIIADGRPVPDKVLKIAAEVTASTKQAPCDVDYTERRNVRRQPGGHPGQVIYVNYKTILASPDMHEEFLLKK